MPGHTLFTTAGFSLVAIRHPETHKWVAVRESRKRGIWLAGGHVDAGEAFAAAAGREAREEGGIGIKLTGILRIEHTVGGRDTARMRVLFLGEPVDPAAPLKSVPDEESEGAFWATVEELDALNSARKLRGHEVLETAMYVARGGTVYPLSLLANEYDPFPMPPPPAADAAAGGAAAGGGGAAASK